MSRGDVVDRLTSALADRYAIEDELGAGGSTTAEATESHVSLLTERRATSLLVVTTGEQGD
jgi:hypothetical protein